MNIIKLITPDYITGRILYLGKAILDIFFLLIRKPSRQSLRFARLILQVTPRYTMVQSMRLIKLYDLVKEVNALNLAGDIVECGVWNGGSAAVMAVACRDDKIHPQKRSFWLFDSFKGLPKPGERDGENEKRFYFEGWTKGDVKNVKDVFNKLCLSLEDVKIIPGWFDSTLKVADVGQTAILHIDADWYESVKTVLENLYDKVIPGGFIVLDDYGRWEGCRAAVDDYIKEHNIKGVKIYEKKTRSIGSYR